MVRTTQRWKELFIVGLAIQAGHAAQAQAFPVMVQVAPGVYRAAPPTIVPSRIEATFSLTQTEEAASGNTVRARYVANRVTLLVVPRNAPGAALRLVGNIEVLTETTLDDSGAGVIRGILTFTGINQIGIVAQLISAQLNGTVGDTGEPIRVDGELNVPAITAHERPLYGGITATLASDTNLSSTLSGLADVEIG